LIHFEFAIFKATTSSTTVYMTLGRNDQENNAVMDRLQFIQQTMAATAAFTFFPNSANAAKYGSFGAGSPEVLDPSTAVVDEEILASEPVQKAFAAVKSYKKTIEDIKALLDSNNQADVGPIIRKELDFVQLRADLNTLNSAFDEETQRGTDRLVRLIMQDVTELETANKQKPGVERSEKRLSIMYGKLEKLNKAFADYLAFV
jgi:hypothetical protein